MMNEITNSLSSDSKRGRRSRALVNLFKKATDDPVETDLSAYCQIVEEIKARDKSSLSDGELLNRARELKTSIQESGSPGTPEQAFLAKESGGAFRSLLAEAFALVREASRRGLGLDPFDVQMIAGLAMARGRVAELPTGEGKTLAAVFPVFFQALRGRGVHVLTFNDYLARRDAAWMGPAYRLLGLSVGCVQEGLPAVEKRAAYACDVTYATAKEAGFDFLRDRIAESPADLVHRPFHAALVDEADSILVDEARIPLVISGIEDRALWDARGTADLLRTLVPGRDYETDDEHRNVFLLEPGTERLEAALGCGGLYEARNQTLLEAIYCALHAEALLRRDVDYIVRGGKIEIVDEFTGRVVDQRHWPDGLQAAVEAKEGLTRRSTGRVLGSITLQHFFRLYPALCGMTATARSAAAELQEFYGLSTVIVPPHIPSRRADRPDALFTGLAPKRRALVREIGAAHAACRPVLVGTSSVKESEELAEALRAGGIACAVLNARNDELEAGIIAEAGRPGAVTISTNMAGRGTDIKLGGADERERDRVVALGGLYVIGTNRHESLRIDRQLRGRAGRQGDPGETRFFISLEDDLFERYGLTRVFRKRFRLRAREEEIPIGAVHREIEHAQRIVEGQNFDIRRTLTKYSELVEFERRIVHEKRDAFLRGEGGEDYVLRLAHRQDDRPAGLDLSLRQKGRARFGEEGLAEIERRVFLHHLDRLWAEHLAWVQDTRESIHLVNVGGMTPLDEFRRLASDRFLEMRESLSEAVASEMRSFIEDSRSAGPDLERLKGPSSTWTYLVNEDQFEWGLETIKSKNIGFAVGAASFYGPLLILTLLAKKMKNLWGKKGEGVPPP